MSPCIKFYYCRSLLADVDVGYEYFERKPYSNPDISDEGQSFHFFAFYSKTTLLFITFIRNWKTHHPQEITLQFSKYKPDGKYYNDEKIGG